MRETSELYKELLSSEHRIENRLYIGDSGRLVTETGESITFGETTISLGPVGPETAYEESIVVSMNTNSYLFGENTLKLGGCVSGEIDIRMINPKGRLPRQARLVPYVRLTDGVRHSEWIQKGVFYLDTRKVDTTHESLKWLSLTGYDGMLKAEADYPTSTLDWPARDIDVVKEIASAMGVSLDPRTEPLMNRGYEIQYPGEYSQREVLGFIAASYGGCFTMNDFGQLRLVVLRRLS